MTKQIPLTQGQVAIVDDADYDNAAREVFGEYAKTNF
jgi:hypothetical protein